jgi:hypothetical protein
MTRLGWDTSTYNPIKLPPVPSAFRIARATQGNYIRDDKYAAARHWAKVHGKLFGAYHFCDPHSSASPDEQARYFLAYAQPRPGDLLVADYERAHRNGPEWLDAFCHRVHRETGANVLVYTNVSVGNTLAGLGRRPLWIASPGRKAGDPILPTPWSKFVLHQFGGVGGVDRDWCNGKPAAVWAKYAVPKPAKPAPGTSIPPATPTAVKVFQGSTTQPVATLPAQNPVLVESLMTAPAPKVIPPPPPPRPSAWAKLIGWLVWLFTGRRPNV